MRGAWTGIVVVGVASVAVAADLAAPRHSTKPSRLSAVAVRVATIHDLAATPTAQAVDEVLAIGGRSKAAPAIQQAALEALMAMGADDEAARRMLVIVKSESAKQASAIAEPLAVTLLSRPDSPAGSETLEWLDDKAAEGSRAAGLLWVAATEMTRRGDADAVRLLVRISETKSFARNFSFRRGILAALISIRRPDAVAALVEILPSLSGEVRADVVAYLTAVSGKRHGLDTAGWAEWWRTSSATFQFHDSIDVQAARILADDDVTSYYGIPLYADRVVFVIDTSGSMAGSRMDSAKRELMTAIGGLPETVAFTVVAFSDAPVAWRATLVPADEAAKRAASSFVAELVPGGLTASFNAIEAAFTFDTEAIYFLSDGEPTTGKLVAPDAIVKVLAEANRSRRLSIYTIGIMPGESLTVFLKALAVANFGIYRQVD